MAIDTADPIPKWKRVLLFARTPFALGVALTLAHVSGFFSSRDAALLGAPASAAGTAALVSAVVILAASVLPGTMILLQGQQRGILLGIGGLLGYLAIAAVLVSQGDMVLPVIAPVVGSYVSQVMGIGWRPHSAQNVRDILPAEQQRVFISYRRSLDEVTARMLKHELVGRGFDVFLDVDNLGPSPRFDRSLLDEITRRYGFLLLLSPGSLDRCAEENDWVRLELEHALRTGRRVIPVTRAGFQLAVDGSLPESISSLPLHNAIAYSSTHHAAVIDQLVGFLCAPRAARGPGLPPELPRH